MDYAAFGSGTFANMLGTLEYLVGKAQAEGYDDAVLAERLTADMFSLELQIRVAINQVLLALETIGGISLKLHEGPYCSLAEIGDRLAETRALLNASIRAGWAAPDTAVDFTLPNGMRFVMTAAEYLRDWIMPNLYFHTTMAYALLRREGLAIGKLDFVPHMTRHAAAPAV